MSTTRTTDELVAQVRDAVDEENTTDLTPTTILRALNLGKNKLLRLAGQHYPQMFKREATLSGTGSRAVDLPEDAFGWRVNEVLAVSGGTSYRVQAAQLQQLTDYDNPQTQVTLPLYYAQVGKQLWFYPTAGAGAVLKVRYQQRVPDLVVAQGRIINNDTAGSRLYLDALGSGLTTSIAALGAFINIIDSTTGEVKVTLQVNGLDTTNNALTYKTTGLDRTSVFGQDVSTEVPTTVELDDYVCLASGTCVPTLLQDYYDYVVQHAVVTLKRKMGEQAPEEYAALKELEEDVKSMWAGREGSKRVARKSPYWGRRLPLIKQYL